MLVEALEPHSHEQTESHAGRVEDAFSDHKANREEEVWGRDEGQNNEAQALENEIHFIIWYGKLNHGLMTKSTKHQLAIDVESHFITLYIEKYTYTVLQRRM